jgi:hypothetical protein
MERAFLRKTLAHNTAVILKVLGILHAEPRRIGHNALPPSFEGPREMRGGLRMTAQRAARKKQEKARPAFRLGPLPLGQFNA